MRRGWDRQLWGVMFRGGRDEIGPIGTLWNDRYHAPNPYHGEPPRALLFTTRGAARAWCAMKMMEYRHYPEGHACRKWKVRPVRVRERVSAIRS